MKVLIAGGGGYLGSHAVRECRRHGIEPVVFDSFVGGYPEAVSGVEQVHGNLLDPRTIRAVFDQYEIDAVIHAAGGGDCVECENATARFYRNEIGGTLNLVHAMLDAGVVRLVFASACNVYGAPREIPIEEAHPAEPRDPLGKAKLRVEEMLAEIAATQPLRHAVLRLFNLAGADPAGDLGEAHRTERHLIPSLFQAALGRRVPFELQGTDYETPDGTCIRDYVHVSDGARACLRALGAVDALPGETFNIASGEGFSVREVIDEAQRLCPFSIPIVEAERRPRQPPALVASIDKARTLLEWEPISSDLVTILRSAWNWHRRFPDGFHAVRGGKDSADAATSALFGDVAIRLGFVTEADVARALERQARELEDGNQHKLIGMHMLEMGLLSTSQLIEILKYYEVP
ncbi:MAG: UDP-glucose 4-epimerase GalE [Planctomycetes bacterium]|nr:UDP-glucose 4-epimerase GalE [Planctomycetota bacterium]